MKDSVTTNKPEQVRYADGSHSWKIEDPPHFVFARPIPIDDTAQTLRAVAQRHLDRENCAAFCINLANDTCIAVGTPEEIRKLVTLQSSPD